MPQPLEMPSPALLGPPGLIPRSTIQHFIKAQAREHSPQPRFAIPADIDHQETGAGKCTETGLLLMTGVRGKAVPKKSTVSVFHAQQHGPTHTQSWANAESTVAAQLACVADQILALQFEQEAMSAQMRNVC